MIWLQSPQWGRWLATGLVVCAALWIEFGPDPYVEHPFAIEHIAAGEPIDDLNTEMRRIPGDLLETVPPSGYALRSFEPDEPLVATGVGSDPFAIPEGWWSVAIDVPVGATLGARVQVVLLDTGAIVPGSVSQVSSGDPLVATTGAIAVSPDHAAAVAVAVANGRAIVLVGTG